MHHAVENTTLIGALKEDVTDVSKWIALAESQTTKAARTQVLTRAVETVPSSQDLWERLVDAKIQSDKANALEVLSNALGLFPQNVTLWQRMFSLFPSVETFNTALRYLDNQLVWPSYLQLLHKPTAVSPEQRLEGYKHYCEYTQVDEHTLKDLALKLVSLGQPDDAAKLLVSQSCHKWEVWEPLVRKKAATPGLLESALQVFPLMDHVIVPILAQKLASIGENNKVRTVLLHAVRSPSSVSAFCALYRVACEFYESTITSLLQTQGAGGPEVSRALTELGNLIRKRPMYLSDAAVREFPHNVELWKNRAALWKHQPHIAADVLETALKTIDPERAYNGDLSDLWIDYTRLLVANGSDVSLARTMLVKALDAYFSKVSEKAKVYIALAELEQNGARNPDEAIRVLETAIGIPALATSPKLWTAYISTLIETKSVRVLEAFSDCCLREMVTLRIVLMVAKSFPDASTNQIVVFDKGVQLFPFLLAYSLWKRYLTTVQYSYGIAELRALYERALKSAEGHRQATEELMELYSYTERHHANGSRIFAKRVLARAMDDTQNDTKKFSLWVEYIDLHDDIDEKRSLCEQAIRKLDDKEASQMALLMAKLEASVGQIERAREIYRYTVRLSDGFEEETAALHEQWDEFERLHGDEQSVYEMAQFLNPSMTMQFVPSYMQL